MGKVDDNVGGDITAGRVGKDRIGIADIVLDIKSGGNFRASREPLPANRS